MSFIPNVWRVAVAIALSAYQAATPDQPRPQPRACHSAASTSDGIVIWGGANACGSGVLNDTSTWTWNGARWTPSPGPGITTREDAFLLPGFSGARLLLIGGRRDGVTHADSWTRLGDTWTPNRATGGPGPIQHGAAAFDEARKRVVVFGGAIGRDMSGKTFEFDGAQWREFDVPGPSPRVGHGMAWSASDGGVLVYGGFAADPFRDLWKWDGKKWERLSNEGPTFTEGHVVTESADGIYIVGPGLRDAAQVRVWLWRAGAFTTAGAPGPPVRVGATATFDRVRRVLVYFGGAGPQGPSNAVHEFDGAQWKNPGS